MLRVPRRIFLHSWYSGNVEAFLVCQQPEALLVFGGAGVEGWLRESEPVELSVKRPMLGGVE